MDEKKHDMFLNGLNDDIQFQLLNTSSTWLTRPWLLKTRSRRCRRMARERCHSMDNPLEAMLGLASRSLTSSSNHHRRTGHRCQCKCRALSFRWSDRTFKHHARASRYRGLSIKHLDPICNNRLTKTCCKAPTLMLQHRRMQLLKEIVMTELVLSVV
jgi:hypothetical protein